MTVCETKAAQNTKIRLNAEWKEKLADEFDTIYMDELRAFLAEEMASGKKILPPGPEIFAAFELTPFSQVKVVILGQDPYHGPDQAHGLCFSVRQGLAVPPSLLNIYKELHSDLGIARAGHGDLSAWGQQGVLLLNSVLTVEQGRPGSHQNRGWERFTDRVIAILNAQKENLVFILWGAYAHKKGAIIDRERHCVIASSHPSPFAARRGFLGSKPFSACNNYLTRHGLEPIVWQL